MPLTTEPEALYWRLTEHERLVPDALYRILMDLHGFKASSTMSVPSTSKVLPLGEQTIVVPMGILSVPPIVRASTRKLAAEPLRVTEPDADPVQRTFT